APKVREDAPDYERRPDTDTARSAADVEGILDRVESVARGAVSGARDTSELAYLRRGRGAARGVRARIDRRNADRHDGVRDAWPDYRHTRPVALGITPELVREHRLDLRGHEIRGGYPRHTWCGRSVPPSLEIALTILVMHL